MISLVFFSFATWFGIAITFERVASFETTTPSELCFPGPDISSEVCAENAHLCVENANSSNLVRVSCPTTCGVCSSQTDIDFSPRNNETLQMKVGLILRCNDPMLPFVNRSLSFYANYTGGDEHPLIPTAEGFVELVPVMNLICPEEQEDEETDVVSCQQVRERATDMALNQQLDFAVVTTCPQSATEIFEAAQIVHFIADPGLEEPLPWSRFKYEFSIDENDYVSLISQAEALGMHSVGIAFLDSNSTTERARDIRNQVQEFSAESLEVVYFEAYSPLADDISLFSLRQDSYEEVYDVGLWDEILFAMKDAGVQYAIFVCQAERVSIMNRIIELKLDFETISFDKEKGEIARYLGEKADYITSTVEYHHSLKTADDTFGSNEYFVAAFQNITGFVPSSQDGFAVLALSALRLAVLRYNSFEPERLMAAFEFMDASTIMGPLKWSLNHVNADVKSISLQTQNGSLETILPAQMASAHILMPTPPWHCRALLNQSDPSICTDAELAVWRDCTEHFRSIKDAFNSTACQTLSQYLASLTALEEDEGKSSKLELWMELLFIALGVFSFLLTIAAIRFRYFRNRSADVLWLSSREIEFSKDMNGEREIINRTAYGPVFAATFRGIQVAVQFLETGQLVALPSTRKASHANTDMYQVRKFSLADNSNNFSEDGFGRSPRSDLLEQEVKSTTKEEIGSFTPKGESVATEEEEEEDEVARTTLKISEPNTPMMRTTSVPNIFSNESSDFYGDETVKRMSDMMSTHPSSGGRGKPPVTVRQNFGLEVIALLQLKHEHILNILGACVDRFNKRLVVMERLDAGTLHDFLSNRTTSLDNKQAVDLLCLVASGLRHLHSQSHPVVHGDLTTRNVYLNHHLNAKIGGFGLTIAEGITAHACTPYWMAPEMFETGEYGELTISDEATPTIASDVYSFAITMWSVFSRQDPYKNDERDPMEVLKSVVSDGLRPLMTKKAPKELQELIAECWHRNPLRRPQMAEICRRLVDISKNITNKHETTSNAQEKESTLLRQVLPTQVVRALREGKKVEPEVYPQVTIFFSDIVGFTNISAKLDAAEVMWMLDRLYTEFDKSCSKYKLFKVETIGDAYMCVGGIPHKQEDQTVRVALFGMEAIQAAAAVVVNETKPELGCVNIRVGMHTGSVIASVVGDLNPRYCLFGDTVNIAAKMESNSEKYEINMSPEANRCLNDQAPGVLTRSRGLMNIKGLGPFECFFLEQDCFDICEDALMLNDDEEPVARAFSSWKENEL